MAPLISVIIPVYNLEHELPACLASVQAQTLSDWEAVCVDDGSTDGSADVLGGFAEADGRFVVLRQENAGVSAARNAGLLKASGKYVFFLDGDDVLHPQALELLAESMRDGQFDVVVSSYLRGSTQHPQFPPIAQTACRELSCAEYFQMDSGLVRSACFKLYRRSLAQSAQFPQGFTHAEDTHYVLQILSQQVRLGFLDAPLYYYFDRQVSASRKLFTASNVTAVLAFHDACGRLKACPDTLLFGMAMKMMLQDALLVRMHLSNNKEVVRTCKRCVRQYLGDWLRCRAIPLRTRIEYAVFFTCPFLYALARICRDPTMLDFYLKKRKKNQESVQ